MTAGIWRTNDTGLTTAGKPYRILAHDLRGGSGPIVAAVFRDDIDHVARYMAEGKHAGGLAYYDLKPPKVRA